MTASARLTAPFSPVPAAVAANGLAGLPGAVTKYARNAEIFGEGDEADFVYRVRSGTVRLTRILPDGRRMIGSFHFAGESFGIEPGATHSSSAEAVTDCEIVATPRNAVFRRAENDHAFSHELWQSAVAELAGARQHMLVLGCQSALERVASFLLEMAERSPVAGVLSLPMSRQDIADYLGLTIETVSRTITQLTERGAIEVPSSRTIVLRNRTSLRSAA
ncbi:MAG: helix-turn-helix domain-containing protein [Bauldia sp.]|nr:helix-turn-helix domain-containing protein [Bauldia sp.]